MIRYLDDYQILRSRVFRHDLQSFFDFIEEFSTLDGLSDSDYSWTLKDIQKRRSWTEVHVRTLPKLKALETNASLGKLRWYCKRLDFERQRKLYTIELVVDQLRERLQE